MIGITTQTKQSIDFEEFVYDTVPSNPVKKIDCGPIGMLLKLKNSNDPVPSWIKVDSATHVLNVDFKD